MSTPPPDIPHAEGAARQEGIAALRAGDATTARRLLSAAVAHTPDDLEAWLWLSGAVSSDAERRYCLLRVQAISPAHPAAVRGLAMLSVVEPVNPVAAAQRVPVAASAPEPEAVELAALPNEPIPLAAPIPGQPPIIPVASAVVPPPIPVVPQRPQWPFWTAVGGMSLVLLVLIGFVVLRLTTPRAPAQLPVVAEAAEPGTASTLALAVASPIPSTLTTAVASPTRPPPPTTTSQPDVSPVPPTAEPTAAAIAVAPGDDSAPALAARGLVRERRDEDLEGAMADYAAAIALDPTYPDTYYLRAALRYNLDEAKSAQDDYAQALQLDMTSVAALYLKGRVEIARGNKGAGLNAYEEALSLDPGYAPAYYSRGVSRANQGDIKGAIADYTAAIEADPTFAFAYYNRGVWLMNTGQVEPALADYTQAIDLDERYFAAYYNRGYLYAYVYRDYQLAFADFDQAVKYRPRAADARCERGNARARLGDLQGGVEDTTHAIELDPQFACAYYSRAWIYVDLGEHAKAIADYTTYIELNEPGSYFADAYLSRGVSHARLGQIEAAIDDYTQVIALNPQEPHAYNNRGNCYITLGDLKAARDDLTIAAELYRQQEQTDDYNRVLKKLRELDTRTT